MANGNGDFGPSFRLAKLYRKQSKNGATYFRRPTIGDWVLIRPNWSARLLWPSHFPKPQKFSEEYERAAAEQREKTLARRKGKLARERAEQNAKFNQDFEHRAIDAQRERYK